MAIVCCLLEELTWEMRLWKANTFNDWELDEDSAGQESAKVRGGSKQEVFYYTRVYSPEYGTLPSWGLYRNSSVPIPRSREGKFMVESWKQWQPASHFSVLCPCHTATAPCIAIIGQKTWKRLLHNDGDLIISV